MTAKPSIITIYTLVTPITCSIKVDFTRNTGNMFSATIRNIIFEYFGYSNNIHIGRWDQKVVIGSNLLNISISD